MEDILMLRIIWKKSFKKMVRKMEYKMREDTIKKIQDLTLDEQVTYANGFDDGFYRACEEILKWMEGKKDKK
jgi:hypothetical protein